MAAPKGTMPPNAGKGRGKGTPNKINKALKDMILGALDDNGGQAYLSQQARENPTAFLTLIGKVLPVTLMGNGEDGAIKVISRIERVIIDGPTVTDG